MNFEFNALSREAKGTISIVLGILILLYAFNFFQRWLNSVVIIGAGVLIYYGFNKLDGMERLQRAFGKKRR